jgi:hypothetical protein
MLAEDRTKDYIAETRIGRMATDKVALAFASGDDYVYTNYVIYAGPEVRRWTGQHNDNRMEIYFRTTKLIIGTSLDIRLEERNTGHNSPWYRGLESINLGCNDWPHNFKTSANHLQYIRTLPRPHCMRVTHKGHPSEVIPKTRTKL